MASDSLSDTTVNEPLRPPAPAAAPFPTVSVGVEVAALTDAGKVRRNNEDNFHVVRFGRYMTALASSLPDDQVPSVAEEAGYAFAVADGMGGMAAGEVASRMAITLLVRHALETPDWIMGRDTQHTAEVIDRAAKRFRKVNEAVIERAESGPGLRGMGTTLSLALTLGDDLIVAHVGDSPVYLHHAGELHKLTTAHTMGERLARLGVTDAGRFHNVLTHAIGIKVTGGEPDIRRYRLADGDRLLLCTDGLTDMVDDATIARELGREASANEVCRSLVDLALANGGRDNVTVVVATFHIPDGTNRREEP